MISIILQITQTENQERGAVPSCKDLQSSRPCVTSDTHWETTISWHLWRQDSAGHSTPRTATETLERLEQHLDWEPYSTANTHSLPSSPLGPRTPCIWRRKPKGSQGVYAVVHQYQGITQQLVNAKSRLAKKNLTITRLELVAGHMAVNLTTNVQEHLA